MTKGKKAPLVAICGRPNVGKSTLFNRLTGRQRAIVHREEGITRDRSYGEGEWHGRPIRFVDTGGIVETPTDPITHKMQEQVRAALTEAAAILFVVDGQQEITRVDEEVRDELFKLGKPVILAANKLDNARLEANRVEFYALGLGDPHAISSTHGVGIEDLMAAVVEHLPPPSEMPEEEQEEDEAESTASAVTRVAVIGKPNVGKSSFINAILNEERTIVTEVPGTTRDSIDIEFRWRGRDYLLIDTAGLRRKSGIKEDVEHFSVSRSLRSVRNADVCLLMMDAMEGLTEQDKRIADYIVEQGRGMVLVWTKWDLVDNKEARFKTLAEQRDFKAPFLRHVPQLTISNLTRQRLFNTFEHIDKVAEMASLRIGTGRLNRFIEELRGDTASSHHKGRQAKILYATQASVKPTVFVLFVNQKRLFHFSYVRHIENRLRDAFGFEGVPLTIELRETQRNARDA